MVDYSKYFSDDVYDFIAVDSIDAEKELKEVCDALKEQGIKHWLSSGTLLGIYREGRLLKDDTDIDIGIMTDKIPILEGYEIKTIRIFGEIMQTLYRSPRNIAVDLMWFYEEGDNIINKTEGGTFIKPKERFENLESIEFKGNKYPCPPAEWYLSHRFITWKTRIPKGRHWAECAGDFLR